MEEEICNNILIMLMQEGIEITTNIKEKLWIILSKYDYGKKVTDLVLTDEDQNNEYIKKFLIAKTVKGCTKRTIEFYGITLRKAIPRINKNVVDITTEDNKKVLVIGNEANGVSKEILDYADEKIKIPMIGKTESLNASVAAGIIMYEYVRQKISK